MGGSSWRIIDPGGPDDTRRVAIQHAAEGLYYPDGTKRPLNFTPEQYQREVVDGLGYLRFEGGNVDPMPIEYAIAFNVQSKEQWDAALAKYPDMPSTWKTVCKGTMRWDIVNSGWIKTDLEE